MPCGYAIGFGTVTSCIGFFDLGGLLDPVDAPCDSFYLIGFFSCAGKPYVDITVMTADFFCDFAGGYA